MSAFLADGDYHWRRRGIGALFALATRIGYRARRPDRHDVATAWPTISSTRSASRADRMRVVHNPVDLAAVDAAAAASRSSRRTRRAWTQPVIVAAGRLAEAKNYPLLHRRARAAARGRAGAAVHPRAGRRGGAIRDAHRRPRPERRRRARAAFSESLEVHRARRRVRADVALRRLRQRAGRGDGLRRAGRGDQLAGHARDRRRRRRRAAGRRARAGGAGRGARARAARRRAAPTDGREAPRRRRGGSRCRSIAAAYERVFDEVLA